MSNDISSSTPTAAPAGTPSSSSESSTASTADYAKLAKSEDASMYAEQRLDDQREADGHNEPDDHNEPDGPGEADGADEQRRRPTRNDRRRLKTERLEERLRAATARAREEAAEQRTTEITPKLPPGTEESDSIPEWLDQLRAADASTSAQQDGGQAENGVGDADAAAYEQPETQQDIDQANEQWAEHLRNEGRNEGRYEERRRIAEATIPHFAEIMATPIQVGMAPEPAQAAWNAITESDVRPFIEAAIRQPGEVGDYIRAELKRATTPAAAVRVIGKIEGALAAGAHQARTAPRPQPQRPLPASWLRKPIAPLKGAGAGPSSSGNDAAGTGDKIDPNWASRRLREMRSRGQ